MLFVWCRGFFAARFMKDVALVRLKCHAHAIEARGNSQINRYGDVTSWSAPTFGAMR
jgi:hypothetical protein